MCPELKGWELPTPRTIKEFMLQCDMPCSRCRERKVARFVKPEGYTEFPLILCHDCYELYLNLSPAGAVGKTGGVK